MAHTYESGTTRFISNSDLSGDIEIIDLRTRKRFAVPGDDLLSFIGNYVRDCKIAELENMEPLDVLQIKRGRNHG